LKIQGRKKQTILKRSASDMPSSRSCARIYVQNHCIAFWGFLLIFVALGGGGVSAEDHRRAGGKYRVIGGVSKHPERHLVPISRFS